MEQWISGTINILFKDKFNVELLLGSNYFTLILVSIWYMASVIVVIWLMFVITTENSFRFGSFSLLIYTHGAHWAAFLIIDQFLHHHHHKSRLQGYLEFYVKTKNIRRAPFYILSIGNAVLMIVVMILHDICNRSSDCSHNFSKVKFLF